MSRMEPVEKKRPRPRRSFTSEFKAEIVELCRRGDRSIGQVAVDFDLTETAVREWVKQADIDDGHRSDGITTAEREELNRLRRENRRLAEDVEILKRATAFFAKDRQRPGRYHSAARRPGGRRRWSLLCRGVGPRGEPQHRALTAGQNPAGRFPARAGPRQGRMNTPARVLAATTTPRTPGSR